MNNHNLNEYYVRHNYQAILQIFYYFYYPYIISQCVHLEIVFLIDVYHIIVVYAFLIIFKVDLTYVCSDVTQFQQVFIRDEFLEKNYIKNEFYLFIIVDKVDLNVDFLIRLHLKFNGKYYLLYSI